MYSNSMKRNKALPIYAIIFSIFLFFLQHISQLPPQAKSIDSPPEIFSKLERCQVHSHHSTALKDTFAAAILTEWEEFIAYDWDAIAEDMEQSAKVFDGRNILQENEFINQYFIGK